MYYSQASSSGVVEEREKRSISAYIKGGRRFMRRFEGVAVVHVASGRWRWFTLMSVGK